MEKKEFKFLFSLICIFILSIFILPTLAYAETFDSPFSCGYTKTSPMYDRTGISGASEGYHDGWDMVSQGDTTVYVPAKGVVVTSSFSGSSGNQVFIKHQLGSDLIIDGYNYGDVIFSYYCHLAYPSGLVAGQVVSKGDVIGVMGNTGTASSGAHLHFAIASEGTGCSFAGLKKPISGIEALLPTGEEWHDRTVYNVLRLKSDNNKACFSPGLIFGMDIDDPQINENEIGEDPNPNPGGGNTNPPPHPRQPQPVVNPEDNEPSTEVEEEEDLLDSPKEEVDTTPPNENHFSNGTALITGATGITNRQDINTPLAIGGGLISYGTFDTLEPAVDSLRDNIFDYSKIIAVVLLFGGTLMCGINIVMNRGNGEKRLKYLTGIGGIGVGALIIAASMLIIQLLDAWFR